jgi:molybdate transport system permease protein
LKIIRGLQQPLFAIAVAITLSFIFLPMIAVFLDMTPKEIWTQLQTPLAHQALKLSVYTTFISLALILLFGTTSLFFS